MSSNKEEKILNLITGRYVKKDGKLGKILLSIEKVKKGKKIKSRDKKEKEKEK